MSSRALKFLLKKEWSMGNGQCPECFGVSRDWLGHPNYLTSHQLGHKHNCDLAAAIVELGGKPLYVGQYKSKKRYEIYLTDTGLFSTRLIT